MNASWTSFADKLIMHITKKQGDRHLCYLGNKQHSDIGRRQAQAARVHTDVDRLLTTSAGSSIRTQASRAMIENNVCYLTLTERA